MFLPAYYMHKGTRTAVSRARADRIRLEKAFRDVQPGTRTFAEAER